MNFYNSADDAKNFVISFSSNPRNDFGAFAKGYRLAGEQLTNHLLEKGYFSDYQAYPIVFLYRQALELHLKHIIYKSALLCFFKKTQSLDTKLYNTHKLSSLSEKAISILRVVFAEDQDLLLIADDLRRISLEFEEIDPESHSYRYPINTRGEHSTKRNQIVSLHSLHRVMQSLLYDLETIDFGINIETDKASEIYEILEKI